ncbi:histidine--tRNA ligase [Candidatus Liberibacter americanus]|uniref:Histidine--tRNA ligase n=1 Tax=Candidatus Liberibacter americanus str. Sao Paulo TaxID=1261131 RepID=U6B8V9_9HYPH|nr:histidine--tRNA ligase [Candidatus Liberibacter americanus]AHA28291.1 Histidyl-tRNA synthetase [Candidatus Liberibacter americanus str. Sao Paulo]EMS36583.1 histidyl-tRNA synthetase [Candidatus Liberibacter americanus PW_SP]
MEKEVKIKAELPRGFVDYTTREIRIRTEIINNIISIYERYGFDPIETPLFEYSEALGKFLPDEDRPNEGVFSIQDDDDQWMSLRYDLTAPLARHVAENFEKIIFPYRTYRIGPVFRNEKPGPGRFRQFIQCDIDNIGSAGKTSDAEMCMMMADTLEAVGIKRKYYQININNRKILDGILEKIGLDKNNKIKERLTVLRAIDKLDKLGTQGVESLLGKGRKDDSGDFTIGANLAPEQINVIMSFISIDCEKSIKDLYELIKGTNYGEEGLDELISITELTSKAGYNTDRIKISPNVVRGLEYYTGCVYEANLQFSVMNKKKQPVVFGAVGGGGRYDGLISRFKDGKVPATGFSIGLSRLIVALESLENLEKKIELGPVLITVMDNDIESINKYQEYTQLLRKGGIRAEMFQGSVKNFGNQLKYADRRNCPLAIIQGKRELSQGMVQIKDLIKGKELSQEIKNNKHWRESQLAQIMVSEHELVSTVKKILYDKNIDK